MIYEIAVFDETKEQCYESFEYVIDFVSKNASFELPGLIEGNTNEDTFFRIRVSDPGSYINRPVIFTFHIPNTTQEQVNLAYMKNGKPQSCKYSGRYYGINGSSNNIMLEQELTLQPNTDLVFKFSSAKAHNSSIYTTLREQKNNKDIPTPGNITELIIEDVATSNIEIENIETIKQIASKTWIEVRDLVLKIQPQQPVDIAIVTIDGKYIYQGHMEDTGFIQVPQQGIYIINFVLNDMQASRKVYVQ